MPHSTVDWFAYAVWSDGALRRSLSLSPDSGVMENIGEPLPFEAPFWAGQAGEVDDEAHDWGDDEGDDDWDDEDEEYPFPFHPLELAEVALQELLGFTFEGVPTDIDPESIPVVGFVVG